MSRALGHRWKFTVPSTPQAQHFWFNLPAKVENNGAKKKKRVKDKGERIVFEARVLIRKNTPSVKYFHSCSVNRYENVFGFSPSTVKTLSMETWNQNTISFAVVAQIPLSVIVCSLFSPTLFWWVIFSHILFKQRWKSQILFLQRLCCYCFVSCVRLGEALSGSAVSQAAVQTPDEIQAPVIPNVCLSMQRPCLCQADSLLSGFVGDVFPAAFRLVYRRGLRVLRGAEWFSSDGEGFKLGAVKQE